MTARQPRRTRRRVAPTTTLPRPIPGTPEAMEMGASEAASPTTTTTRSRRTVHHREHHVTTDYSHVHRDLLTVLVIGVVVLGFIFGMSFVIS